MSSKYDHLPYNPQKLNRELKKYYISLTDQEIEEMTKELQLNSTQELFAHIPDNIKFEQSPNIGEELEYDQLLEHMEQLAAKNKIKSSFIGDGIKNYKIPSLVNHVAGIRGLLTAYTPYQPERSQGTLTSLYLYSSALSMLTGFEAVNSSMYDRSTCLFEALNASLKIVRRTNTVLVSEAIFPGDLEVLETLQKETPINIITIPVDQSTGLTDINKTRELVDEHKGQLAAIAFPQVNSLGNLEDVHAFTDLCHENKLQSIAIIDPMHLATGGLTPPSKFGSSEQGAHMIVGEGQHLAIGPSFGGPGLGIFGIRYNDKNKMAVRSTAGRYVGKAQDENGKEALTMVLSTREQHIRREKASSNICSNQAFIAALAGAGVLARGESGMSKACAQGYQDAQKVAKQLCSFKGVELAYPNSAFYNEFTLSLPINAQELISKANQAGIHLGVDVTERTGGKNALLLSFTDVQTDEDINKLINFFEGQFEKEGNEIQIPTINDSFLRKDAVDLPNFSEDQLKSFYNSLGEQNVSPDDVIYPLGSCTMKYNPYINEYAASLNGFMSCHPQAPVEDCQGSLELLYETQEMFKKMTGLAGVTTQPLAGAQGEMAGLKMFQAYHRDNGESETRNIILIPHSAHGTNPATATMAGFETKKIGGVQYGIVLIEANEQGQMDMNQIRDLVKEYDKRIAGIMVTNPNTSGIFETEFKEMAELIHSVGGLVYLDGANLNAIAGHIDLSKMGVDAVHSNLHKTWSTPHGGGGPGSATVTVSERLVDYLPGEVVVKNGDQYQLIKPSKSIGSMHRHFGNFGVTAKCYTYLKALGSEGIKRMSELAVLSSRYLYKKLQNIYPTLPAGTEDVPRMHEFILTISNELFDKIEKAGTPKATTIAKIGKLFLDFGLHAPTVAFPEIYGLMVEPTESYTKAELDRFVEVVSSMHHMLEEHPEVLITTPHFTPVSKVDEVAANKNVILCEKITALPSVASNRVTVKQIQGLNIKEVYDKILRAHSDTRK